RKIPLTLHGVHRRMLLLPEPYKAGPVELNGWFGLCHILRTRHERLRLRLALGNFPEIVSRKICPGLRSSAQPVHFQAINPGRRPQTDMYPAAVLRKVGRTADRATYRDFARPGDECCAIAESQRGSGWRDPAVQPELRPVALRDVITQEPHTFPLVHDSHIHRTVIVEVRNRQSAAHVRLREGAVPRRQVIEETALGIPE